MSQIDHGGAGAATRPLVVASLIVRDEASLLGDCLASLEGFADEIVVCDTGSVDDTVAIAASAGAHVVHSDWVDDFSAARNVALEACGETDWILWIDADERLSCADPAATRAALAEQHAELLAVELENRTDGRITSRASVGRLFVGAGLRFEGSVHERLVRADGSEPSVDHFDLVRIEHVGYDPALANTGDKAARNLSIAAAAFAVEPNLKTVVDWVRSLGFAGTPPEEMLAAVEVGLQSSSVGTPAFEELLSTRAALRLRTGDADGAFVDAAAVLESAPGNDVAAVVLARSATDLGRDAELLAAIDSDGGATDSIRTPRNRVEALGLAAAAALREGEPERAAGLVAEAARHGRDDAGRWDVIFGALSGSDAAAVIEAVAAAAETDAPSATAAALRVWGEKEAAALSGRVGEITDPPRRLGITLSYGGHRLPIDRRELQDWVPGRRRILEWTGDADLAQGLAVTATQVTSLDPADVEGALDGFAATGARFDVILGGVAPGQVEGLLSSLDRVVDPSGVIGLWQVGDDGFAVYPASITAVLDAAHGELSQSVLQAAGFIPETLAPAGVIAGRPVWKDNPGQVEMLGEPPLTVAVWSTRPLSEEIRTAYRASLPGHFALEVIESDEPLSVVCDALPDGAVLIATDDTIVPDPRWIQACADAAAGGRAVAPRVIDAKGFTIQMGRSASGRVIGAGEPASLPHLQTTVRDVELIRPFALPSAVGVTGDAMTGDVLGSSMAVSVGEGSVATDAVSLRELFGSAVLFVGGASPGSAGQEPELEKTFQQLLQMGITPVYQWEDRSWDPDPVVIAGWREAGVVVFPPSPFRRQPGQFSPDPHHPRADALTGAFDVRAIVYLSSVSIEWDFQTIARASIAPSLYVSSDESAYADRADAGCTLAELADRLARLLDEPLPESPVAVRPIEPVSQKQDLVSIVIPVFNKWALTKRCLRSIARYTAEPYEIIVVDNASSDGTADGLHEFDVRVVKNSDNLGFPAAVNQGITASTGEFVCVLNNDTEVTPGWIDEMLAALSVPGTGIVGPRSNRIAGLQQVPEAPDMSNRAVATKWADRWRSSRHGATWTIGRLIGFCMLVRRDTFEALGGFDEGFGIGNYEDDELGSRVVDAGMTLRVADGAVVLHHGGATFAGLERDFVKLMHRAKRHLGDRGRRTTSVAATVVLSDGNPIGAAAAAATAGMVTDRVVIAERGPMASTELTAASVRSAHVEVVMADWATTSGLQKLLSRFDGTVLVMGSQERVIADDWGAARAEVESVAGAVGVATSSGVEIRLVPAQADAVDLIGHPGSEALQTLSLASSAA